MTSHYFIFYIELLSKQHTESGHSVERKAAGLVITCTFMDMSDDIEIENKP